MNKIVPAFECTLLEPVFSSALEMTEVGIDSILDEGLLKSLPIVSLMVGLGKTAINIHDRNLLKQTIKFIQTFNNKTIDISKLDKYRESLKDDSKRSEDELGRVLIILNNTIDIKKSEYLAKMFAAYVEELITWEQFCELSEAISRLFVSDISLLYEIFNGRISNSTQCKKYRVDRLLSTGMITTSTKSITVSNNNNHNTDYYLGISDFGRLFCNLSE